MRKTKGQWRRKEAENGGEGRRDEEKREGARDELMYIGLDGKYSG